METGKTSKYLKYAIGEIILVVIGILIALQVNNWNENRKDRKKELTVLSQIKEDYNSNLKQLDEKIDIRKKAIISSKWLLSYIDGNPTLSKDSILIHLGKSGYAATFDPINQQLMGSEILSYIRNDKLKHMLSSWSSEVVQVTEEEQDWNQFKDDVRTPFLVKQNVIRNLIDMAWNNDEILITFTDQNATKTKVEIGKSKSQIDYESIIKIPEFESILAFGISRNAVANVQSMTLRQRILEILEIVDQEINELSNE